MANLKNVIYLSNEDYETLASTGTVTIDGETLTYDENNVYITPDKLASTTEDGLMSATDKSKLDNIESGAQVNVQSDWNQTDTGADDYIKNKPEVDTDFSLTSTNALQNKVISEKLEYIDYALTHIKYKLFGVTTLSEIDYKVDYATIYPIPETLSDDDGTHRVVYSDTQLKEIEGNSFAFNQLAKNGNFANGTTEWYAVASNGTISASDNVLTYTMTTAGAYNYSNAISQYAGLHFIAGRKYLISAQVKSSKSFGINVGLTRGTPTSQTNYTIQTTNNWQTAHCIGTVNDISGTQTKYSHEIQIYVDMRNAEIGDTYQVRNCMAFDLTLMFGSGNEPTSIDDARLTKLLSQYNEYNAGEIKNTVIKGVHVRNSKLATVPLNKISVVDLGTLDWRYISSNGRMANSSLNGVIKKHSNYIGKPNIVCAKYTTDTPQSLESANPTNLTISIGGNGIDILIYDSSYTDPTAFKNAMSGVLLYYECAEPQETISPEVVNEFIIKTIQIPQTELPSAGSVHDTIKIVEGNIVAGQQRYNMVQVSRIGSVDLGTLNWTWQSANNRWFTSNLSTLVKLPTSNDNKANIIAEKYEILSFTNANTNSRGMALTNSGNLFYYTSDSTNAPSGILNYEKTEPTETTLATDLTFEEVSAIIEQGGSIEALFENVPPNIKTAFVVNKVIVS